MPRQDGFTLLEVVVAFAILSVTLGAIYQSFFVTLHGAESARQRERALLIAESRLSEVRAIPLRVGHRSNTSDGFEWETEIEPLIIAQAEKSTWTVPAYDVAVRVRWGAKPAEQIELHSLELGASR